MALTHISGWLIEKQCPSAHQANLFRLHRLPQEFQKVAPEYVVLPRVDSVPHALAI